MCNVGLPCQHGQLCVKCGCDNMAYTFEVQKICIVFGYQLINTELCTCNDYDLYLPIVLTWMPSITTRTFSSVALSAPELQSIGPGGPRVLGVAVAVVVAPAVAVVAPAVAVVVAPAVAVVVAPAVAVVVAPAVAVVVAPAVAVVVAPAVAVVVAPAVAVVVVVAVQEAGMAYRCFSL